MPIQIKTYNKNSLYLDTENKLDKQAEAYYFDKHFKVGKGYSIDEVKKLTLLNEVFSNDRCEISDYLNKKLNGK